jgi:AAHS family 4-hydroxybenzoate transporter-like MFS transporter
LRASFVLAIYCGFSLGFVAAGGLAATLIPLFGWRSLLWVGAVTPIVVAVLIFVFLPESIDFMIRKNRGGHEIWRVLRRIDGHLSANTPGAFATDVEERRGAVASLFQSGRATGTLVLWFAFLLNLGLFYALQSWLPTILGNLGFSLGTVALATSLTTIGGIVAAFVIGPAMDRIGPYSSLATVYFAGVLFVALLGFAVEAPVWVLLVAAFCAGFCISGGQKSIIALAAIFYPAPIRSTGVGWALGIGRLGGIAGPLLIGGLLNLKVGAATLFFSASLPMLLAGLSIAYLGRHYGGAARDA